MILPNNVDSYDSAGTSTCNLQLGNIFTVLPCDAWHHYYHYQSSAQYLWLAITLQALGRHQEANEAFTKSIFQDHFNEDAICGKEGKRAAGLYIPLYNKHPDTDALFCTSVGRMATTATSLHDAAAEFSALHDYPKAIALLEKALAAEPRHSNSHFTLGKCFATTCMHSGEEYLGQAAMHFGKAITLSHEDHNAYHRHASDAHVSRGDGFLSAGDIDLAIGEFSKALNLFAANTQALTCRARAYRTKGSLGLAQADEACIALQK